MPPGTARSVPPPPPPRREDTLQLWAKANEELRLLRIELERSREQLRGRDLHISELKRELGERSEELAALKEQLATRRPEPMTESAGDDLKRIRGIGPLYEQKLKALGVTTYRDVAAWQAEDLQRIAAELGTHASRIERGGWVEQAKALLG